MIRREREASGDRRERQDDVSLNQQPNQALRERSLGVSAKILGGNARARSECMFEIINPKLDGLAACYGFWAERPR